MSGEGRRSEVAAHGRHVGRYGGPPVPVARGPRPPRAGAALLTAVAMHASPGSSFARSSAVTSTSWCAWRRPRWNVYGASGRRLPRCPAYGTRSPRSPCPASSTAREERGVQRSRGEQRIGRYSPVSRSVPGVRARCGRRSLDHVSDVVDADDLGLGHLLEGEAHAFAAHAAVLESAERHGVEAVVG